MSIQNNPLSPHSPPIKSLTPTTETISKTTESEPKIMVSEPLTLEKKPSVSLSHGSEELQSLVEAQDLSSVQKTSEQLKVPSFLGSDSTPKTTVSTPVDPLSTIEYHEPQEQMLCAKHALNNLLGASVYSPDDLRQLSRQIAKDNPHVTSEQLFDPNRGTEPAVVVKAFEAQGIPSDYSMVSGLVRNKGILSRSQALANALSTSNGFIIGTGSRTVNIPGVGTLPRDHYVAVRKVGSDWVLVDSMKSKPVQLDLGDIPDEAMLIIPQQPLTFLSGKEVSAPPPKSTLSEEELDLAKQLSKSLQAPAIKDDSWQDHMFSLDKSTAFYDFAKVRFNQENHDFLNAFKQVLNTQPLKPDVLKEDIQKLFTRFMDGSTVQSFKIGESIGDAQLNLDEHLVADVKQAIKSGDLKAMLTQMGHVVNQVTPYMEELLRNYQSTDAYQNSKAGNEKALLHNSLTPKTPEPDSLGDLLLNPQHEGAFMAFAQQAQLPDSPAFLLATRRLTEQPVLKLSDVQTVYDTYVKEGSGKLELSKPQRQALEKALRNKDLKAALDSLTTISETVQQTVVEKVLPRFKMSPEYKNMKLNPSIFDKSRSLRECLSDVSKLDTSHDAFARENTFKVLRNTQMKSLKVEFKQVLTLDTEVQYSLKQAHDELGRLLKKDDVAASFEKITALESMLTQKYMQLGQAIATGKNVPQLAEDIAMIQARLKSDYQQLAEIEPDDRIQALVELKLEALDLRERRNKLDILMNVKTISGEGLEYLSGEAGKVLDKGIFQTKIEQSYQAVLEATGGEITDDESLNEALNALSHQKIQNLELRAAILSHLFEKGLGNVNLFQGYLIDRVRSMDEVTQGESFFEQPEIQSSVNFQIFTAGLLKKPYDQVNHLAGGIDFKQKLDQAGISTQALTDSNGQIDLRAYGKLKEIYNDTLSMTGLLSESEQKNMDKRLEEAGLDPKVLFKGTTWIEGNLLKALLEAIISGNPDSIQDSPHINTASYDESKEPLIALAKGMLESNFSLNSPIFDLYKTLQKHPQSEILWDHLGEEHTLPLKALQSSGKVELAKVGLLQQALKSQDPTLVREDEQLSVLYTQINEDPHKNQLIDALSQIPGTKKDLYDAFNKGEEQANLRILMVEQPFIKLAFTTPGLKDYYDMSHKLRQAGEIADLNASRRVPIFLGEINHFDKQLMDEFQTLKARNLDAELKRQEMEQILKRVGWGKDNLGRDQDMTRFRQFFHDFFMKELGL